MVQRVSSLDLYTEELILYHHFARLFFSKNAELSVVGLQVG